MTDLRQSPQYANYLELLGWEIERIDNCYIFIRQFPLLGSIIKIQRPENIPPIEKIFAVVKKYRTFQVSIEPLQLVSESAGQLVSKYGLKPAKSPYLPTKTIHLDLTRSEEKIFKSFSSSKRRAIRKAIKNKVVVKDSPDIESFIKLKNQQGLPLTLFLRYNRQFLALWQAFWPKKATLLLAFQALGTFDTSNLLGGILLLFHDKVAYYYQAASTRKGNKLAVPSFLVWEALKLAKKKGCKIFDFEGIYDPRFPQKSWLGFTKFKKGFGEREVAYPPPLAKKFFYATNNPRMKKVNFPTSKMAKFAGKWVAIDRKKNRIIAAGETLEEIGPLVSAKVGEERKIKATAFLVPRKDEGPYVLIIRDSK